MVNYNGKLMSEIRKNSRVSFTDLGRILKLPVSTVFSRVKRLEESSIILRYFSVLDLTRLGFVIQITYFVEFKHGLDGKALQYLTGMPNVNNIVKLDEGYSIEAYFKDFGTFYTFKDELEPFLQRKTEILIIDEIKREDFLSRERDFR